MSSAVSFGSNTNAQRKRVYFTGATTVYQGMPMCYDDSTTNVLGVDRYDSSASTTTTEGYLNEGRFLRVEIPASDNVDRFAGVVAHGPKVGTTGPCWLDIFIPNGAVVPIRTDVACVEAVTVLSIEDGEEELGAAGTRPVAIARETLSSTTARLILAELNPFKFIYANSSGTALDPGISATDLHQSRAVSTSTTGFDHLDLRTELSGVIASGNFKGILSYMNVSGAPTAAGATYISPVGGQLNISGTLNGAGLFVFGMMAQVHGSGTITSAEAVAGLWVDVNLTGTITTADVSVLYLTENCTGTGAGSLDQFIHMRGSGETNKIFSFTGFGLGSAIRNEVAEPTWGAGGNKCIKISVDGTTYYIHASTGL